MSKPANVVCDPVTGVCRYIPDATPEAPPQVAITEEDSALVTLLGPTLKSKIDSIPTASLAGASRVVGLYFSAHWCGPCRMFTPMLAKFYQQFKETHARKDDFEIVFVSSDRDTAAFDDYYSEMPWLALPYEDRTTKNTLSKKFKVQGIPTLVLIDAATGNTITDAGREKVMTDPAAEDFPWIPRSFQEVLMACELISADGTAVPAAEALKGKVILLYFSAHWCPPCRMFTPKLVETYKKLKAAGKNVEAVFVSGDHDKEQFQDYLSGMPWLAVPYEQEKIRNELNGMFDVEGIPTLILLEDNGKVITSKGRSAVDADPEGTDFPWKPKPLDALTDSNVADVNEIAMLILAGPGDIKSRGTDLLQSLATQHKASDRADDLSFVFGSTDDKVVKMVLDFFSVPKAAERDTLFILDVPEQRKYVFDGPEVTEEVVGDLVARFLRGSLPMAPLSRPE